VTLRSLLAPRLAPEVPALTALLALALLGVALEALLPWPLKLVIDSVLGAAPMPASAAWVQGLPGATQPKALLAWLALGVLLVFLLSQLVQAARGVLIAGIGSRMHLALGRDVLERLQQLSLLYHRRAQRGDLVRRVTTDSACISALVGAVAVPLVTSLVLLLVLLRIMWELDPGLAALAALVAVPMVFLMRWLAPRMADRAYAHQEAEGMLWTTVERTLSALPAVQAFGREADEKLRFSAVAARSVRAYMRSLATQVQFRIGVDGCETAGIALIMVVGGLHVLRGELTIGALVVFFSYMTALYAPLAALAYLTSTVTSAVGSARRVAEVLEATDVLPRARGAPPLIARRCGEAIRVRLEDVSFGYSPGAPVLRELDLDVRPGETVALVGPTGAGKSTLLSLIPRLFDPWSGRVYIGDRDVRACELDSVRASCALVLQEPFILPVTVAQNIAYGRPHATQREIEAAARAANAQDFIERLPQGYDTLVGERGATLSVGQRQRLSIARALLKDAPVVLLDEPTSALDVLTEAAVLEALQRLLAGRTSIVIAHRLSTIRSAQRIVVMDAGEIVATGTHESLAAECALYRALYFAQMMPGVLAVPRVGST